MIGGDLMYLRKMVAVTIYNIVTYQDHPDLDKDIDLNYQCWIKSQSDNRYG